MDERSHEVARHILAGRRRVLFWGEPGTGKSTLLAQAADRLVEAGESVVAVAADPGSPAFGPPGSSCSGRRVAHRWEVLGCEALCTLNAGRYRLPVVTAVRRLIGTSPLLLLDAPGVAHGMAGAELLTALVEVAGISLVVELAPAGASSLAAECAALGVALCQLQPAPEARRLATRERRERRTRVWDAHLAGAINHWLDLSTLPLVGAPPPLAALEEWPGRQVALLDARGATLVLGEAVRLEEQRLLAALPVTDPPAAKSVLVRDARRSKTGLLVTALPRNAGSTEAVADAEQDMLPAAPAGVELGPPPTVRLSSARALLINGIFEDPLLHLRLRHERRSLLFDLGEAGRLQARIAHQVSEVFISHAHFDHIAGFLWLLRSRIGVAALCRIFGPPGLGDNIEGLVRGIHWDRVGERGPRFEVLELWGDELRRCHIRAGEGRRPLPPQPAPAGLLLSEPGLRVRAVALDHGTPSLAFSFEEQLQLNVRKERLLTAGLEPGPWLAALKRHAREGERDKLLPLPGGAVRACGELADELLCERPGDKIVYATDLDDTASNRNSLIELAAGAHTLFCEATFLAAEEAQARKTKHLTAPACAEIARAAGVGALIPFHFSRRHERHPEQIYAELLAGFERTVVPRALLAGLGQNWRS